MFSKKPNVDPPKGLDNPDYPEADFSGLYELLEKHKEEASRMANIEFGGTKSWVEMREHLKKVVNFQLSAINNFLDRHFYEGNQERKDLYQTRIHQYSNFAASGSWVVGREWGAKDPELRQKLSNARTVEINLLPDDVVEHLRLSIFELYSLFYFPHKFFYESRYGRRTRKQRKAHMRDTYQSMMKAALICFLSGLKSHDHPSE